MSNTTNHNPLNNIELVGSKGSPYVKRVVMLLIEHQIPFKYKTIDVRDKPQWFVDRAPAGKVPFVMLDNGEFLFESVVIMEYLDLCMETNKQLSPSNPLLRAQNRAWIEYGTGVIQSAFAILKLTTQEEFDNAVVPVEKSFTTLDKQIKGPYFNGAELSLVDLALVPMIDKLIEFDMLCGLDIGNKFKNKMLSAWVDTMHALPSNGIAMAVQLTSDSIDTSNIQALKELKVDERALQHAAVQRMRDMGAKMFPGSYFMSLVK